MSDRLPFRRRSGGGKHVATRSSFAHPAGLLQAGVAAALAAGLGLVAVNPALGGPQDQPAALAPFASANAAEHAAWVAQRDRTRQDLADVAGAAVAQLAQVRAKAQSAQLPADQLAALDALEQQVDALVGQVEPERLDEARVSRAGERAADDEGAAVTSDDVVAGQEVADPTVADESAAAVPPDAPTPDPASVGTDPATSPSSDAAPDDDPTAGETTDPADGSAAPAASGDPAAAADPTEADVPAIDVTDAATLTAALPEVAADEDPEASALRDTLLALAEAAGQVEAAVDAAQAAQAAAEEAAAEAAAREAERQEWADSLDGYPNGRIPASALCAPAFDPDALLRCDAAAALDDLDAAYRAVFGTDLQVTDSYRSYAAQVTCRAQKGNLCAQPGTSNHGWGLAVDLGGAAHGFGTDAHDWLLANAPTYGWTLPAWARADGSKPEPWHWEYAG